jgi:hypothetical protein
MRLVILSGPVASGKLTIGRLVAERADLALFHNHLVVDAVGALFPFGSDAFVQLRERLWLDLIDAGLGAGRDILFTFAPEPSVPADFLPRLIGLARSRGAIVHLVALTLDPAEQERRLTAPDRAAFGKLRDLDLFRAIRPELDRSAAAMPPADLTVDTTDLHPEQAAARIAAHIA